MEEIQDKPKRAKKEISPERKKQLLEQLKKAREKAAANRAAKKAAKPEPAEPKKPAAKKPAAKKPAAPVKDNKDYEIERLNEKIKQFTLQDIARKSKPKPKPKKEKKVKFAAVEDTDDEQNEIITDVEPQTQPDKDDEFVEPKQTVEPEPIVVPPSAPQVPPPQPTPPKPVHIASHQEPSPPVQLNIPPKPPTKLKKNLLVKKRTRRR